MTSDRLKTFRALHGIFVSAGLIAIAPAAEASEAALQKLFPNTLTRAEFESATKEIWQMTEYRCAQCHGASDGQGWSNHRMPYFNYWKSAIVPHLKLSSEKGNAKGPGADQTPSQLASQFDLYRMLANDYSDETVKRMPPDDQDQVIPTNRQFLDQISDSSWMRDAKLKTLAGEALGTQLIYTNPKGICFDVRNSDLDPNSGQLCDAFLKIAQIVQSGGGAKVWNALTESAKAIPHFDPKEGDFKAEETDGKEDQAGAGGNILAPMQKLDAQQTVIRKLGPNESLSFYTRVAPDNSFLAFSLTNMSKGISYRPLVMDLRRPEAPLAVIQNAAYDGIFSPDFNADVGAGFMLSIMGRGATDTSKQINLHIPFLDTVKPIPPKLTLLLDNISGYDSIAKIESPEKVNPAWKAFAGKYIIMGKRWNWVAVDVERDANGRVIDIRRIDRQAPNLANSSVCKTINLNGVGRAPDFADTVLSQDGQFAAIKLDVSRAAAIISTKDCNLLSEHSEVLKDYFGGKPAFSNDSRYMAFHAYGPNGKQTYGSEYANKDFIMAKANAGWIANIFIYDLQTRRIVQVTDYSQANSYLAFFPNFAADGTLYFHRNKKGDNATEIVQVKNPFSYFHK